MSTLTSKVRDARDVLLNLSPVELVERQQVKADYYFYKGESINEAAAQLDAAYLGQNWIANDNVDYKPTQDIRNKIKPLLKKQARFMFSQAPTINFRPDNQTQLESADELRGYIDDILDQSHFWRDTKKAFLMSTIKKRVLLRVEANPDANVEIKYENIEDFSYRESADGRLFEVRFFAEDEQNVYHQEDASKRIYYVHTYYYDRTSEAAPWEAFYRKQTFAGNDLGAPIEDLNGPTGFSSIPCWLIKNGGELGDDFGESDVAELRTLQDMYNRKNSDFADALRFQMFGAESIIDGHPEDVNRLVIAPNAVHAVRTDPTAAEAGRQASMQRLEYSMGNASAVNSYLDRVDKDMRDTLDMPNLSDLASIPSAKAMKYLFNDLIGRCEEKWTDWEYAIRDLIQFIIEASPHGARKSEFKQEWLSMKYTVTLAHNYPLPSDEEDKRTLAMKEVENMVRSHESYIRDFSDSEDFEAEFETILADVARVNAAQQDQYSAGVATEITQPDTDPITDPEEDAAE